MSGWQIAWVVFAIAAPVLGGIGITVWRHFHAADEPLDLEELPPGWGTMGPGGFTTPR